MCLVVNHPTIILTASSMIADRYAQPGGTGMYVTSVHPIGSRGLAMNSRSSVLAAFSVARSALVLVFASHTQSSHRY